MLLLFKLPIHAISVADGFDFVFICRFQCKQWTICISLHWTDCFDLLGLISMVYPNFTIQYIATLDRMTHYVCYNFEVMFKKGTLF